MAGLEEIKKKLKTADDLLGVVKTMKSMAAVNMRHFEGAVEAMDEYAAVVDLGRRALFRNHGYSPPRAKPKRMIILSVGSDQGMCGRFNEAVLEKTMELMEEAEEQGLQTELWTSGERLRAAVSDELHEPQQHFRLPGGIAGIADRVREVVEAAAQAWSAGPAVMKVAANRPLSGAKYAPQTQQALPPDWRSDRAETALWPTNVLPMLGQPADELFLGLLRQRLFVTLYGAFGRSMAAENAARLMSMQAAEKNIMEMQDELADSYRETRQDMITSELLDVIVGAEAVGD